MGAKVHILFLASLFLYLTISHARPKEAEKKTHKHHENEKRTKTKELKEDAGTKENKQTKAIKHNPKKSLSDRSNDAPEFTGRATGNTNNTGPVLFPGEPSPEDVTTPRVFLYNTSTTHPPDVIDARKRDRNVQKLSNYKQGKEEKHQKETKSIN